MAMLHPSDHFSSTEPLSHVLISSLFVHRLSLIPEAIASPSSSQGSYHKIYFVRLPTGEGLWAGREVVLRVARKAITCIKVENEVAMIELVRRAGVPAPEVMFYSSDISQTDNVLGYEYICQERISYPALSDTYNSLSPKALGNVISQLVDIFIKMFDLQLPGGGLYGSLRVCTDGNIGSGPVIEETMWQISDIKRYFTSEPYNLSSETFSTLNPTSSYPTYPAYVSAFLKTYHHVISIHPAVTFLVHLLGPLQKLIEKLDEAEENWVKRLRDEKGLRGRLWHKDFHFGNLLCDDEGNIRSVIDWEFAGIGPSFAKRSSPLSNALAHLRELSPTSPLLDTWPVQFSALLEQRAPAIASTWAYESDKDHVLGTEGKALSDVREFLRSCLEVGVRGWGPVEQARGAWKDTVEVRLRDLGCL